MQCRKKEFGQKKMKLISACTREWSLFSCKEFELRDTVVLYFFYGKCNIKKQILKSDIMIHLMSKMSLADDQQKDKLWEIKTWVEQLRNRFLEIPPEENHAVDEIMVSFKGKV